MWLAMLFFLNFFSLQLQGYFLHSHPHIHIRYLQVGILVLRLYSVTGRPNAMSGSNRGGETWRQHFDAVGKGESAFS
jgi:hypothetical protein